MKKIIRLTESDLARIVRRVISEQQDPNEAKVMNIIKSSQPANAQTAVYNILNACKPLSAKTRSGNMIGGAQALQTALKGAGTDEVAIYNQFKNVNNNVVSLCTLALEYNKLGTDLYTDLAADIDKGSYVWGNILTSIKKGVGLIK